MTLVVKTANLTCYCLWLLSLPKLTKENTLNLQPSFREDISDYVAELQLHMTLQARNLIPTIIKAQDSREQLLQETQAKIEKFVSREMKS